MKDRPFHDGEWLVIGGGPSSVDGIDYRTSRRRKPRVAATNTGLIACETAGLAPDLIWISCPIAMKKFGRTIRRMRAAGSTIVCADVGKARSALIRHDLHPADVLCPVPPRDPYALYEPGKWHRCRFSGLMLLQFLLNVMRPEAITLAGFDGYPEGWVDELAEQMLPAFLQSCIDATPQVEWSMVRTPNYTVTGATFLYAEPAPD